MSFDLNAGTARYSLNELPIPDYHATPNALAGGPSDPAVVSFDARWMPGTSGRRFHQTDEANRFTGDYSEGVSTITWSARQAGFQFVSDPSTTAQSMFAIVGRERNGVYFSAPSGSPPATQPPGNKGGNNRQASSGKIAATGAGTIQSHVVAGGALTLGGLALWLASRAPEPAEPISDAER